MKIETRKVEEILCRKLESDVISDWEFTFEENAPASCEVRQGKIGKWYGVKILVKYVGQTWDPSTDKALGDPEEGHAWYDWIGLAETMPKIVTKPEELDDWAHLSTYYRMTLRDVQVLGSAYGDGIQGWTCDGPQIPIDLLEEIHWRACHCRRPSLLRRLRSSSLERCRKNVS